MPSKKHKPPFAIQIGAGLLLAALGIATYEGLFSVGRSIHVFEPAIPEHLRETEEAAMAYILTEANENRYLANSKYCDSKVHADRLYILCGLPSEGWGALFHVEPHVEGNYSLFAMNGPAISMTEKHGLVASKIGLDFGVSASDILPVFGSPPKPDPGPQAPVPAAK